MQIMVRFSSLTPRKKGDFQVAYGRSGDLECPQLSEYVGTAPPGVCLTYHSDDGVCGAFLRSAFTSLASIEEVE